MYDCAVAKLSWPTYLQSICNNSRQKRLSSYVLYIKEAIKSSVLKDARHKIYVQQPQIATKQLVQSCVAQSIFGMVTFVIHAQTKQFAKHVMEMVSVKNVILGTPQNLENAVLVQEQNMEPMERHA